MRQLNRIKVVLVEQNKTAKWLAEQIGKMLVLCLVGVQIIPSQTLKLCFILRNFLMLM